MRGKKNGLGVFDSFFFDDVCVSILVLTDKEREIYRRERDAVSARIQMENESAEFAMVLQHSARNASSTLLPCNLLSFCFLSMHLLSSSSSVKCCPSR
jgi:hypothetical protein